MHKPDYAAVLVRTFTATALFALALTAPDDAGMLVFFGGGLAHTGELVTLLLRIGADALLERLHRRWNEKHPPRKST